ncbi:MAG TPA: helix-turn-helix domain-containing protein [Candidatus Levybacteria bacterium]|nr:helix-turn-helix domain-containing protein [Candidatus Levybacteria bacterium]
MARILDRQKALQLRSQGKTYTEIRRELGIPKSTLSEWLSTLTLDPKQLKILQKKKAKSREIAIEKTRVVKQNKRNDRLTAVYNEERALLIPLTQRELLIAGLFLYWGEGGKHLQGSISLNNTDPAVIKFYLYWITQVLHFPKSTVKVALHLYSDMDEVKEKKYWSYELRIPLQQFTKPYIKKSKRSEIDQKGFGHGTCGLRVNNVRMKEKIIMGIKALSDHYNSKI